MRKSSAKISSIGIRKLLLRRIDILAPRTVQLGPCDFEILVDCDRHHILFFAHNSGTVTKPPSQIMFPHDGHSFGRADVSRMDQAVEHRGMDIQFGESSYFAMYFGS